MQRPGIPEDADNQRGPAAPRQVACRLVGAKKLKVNAAVLVGRKRTFEQPDCVFALSGLQQGLTQGGARRQIRLLRAIAAFRYGIASAGCCRLRSDAP